MVAAYDLVTELEPAQGSAEDVSERLQRRVAEFFAPESGESESSLGVKVVDTAVRRKCSGASPPRLCSSRAVSLRQSPHSALSAGELSVNTIPLLIR